MREVPTLSVFCFANHLPGGMFHSVRRIGVKPCLTLSLFHFVEQLPGAAFDLAVKPPLMP
ncbi:MAG: hypothetical protein O6945_06290 [Gammaproteobacteria bacterium]|nr:hypothetical protein [Gammaproteobacteria bacterium]